MSRSETAERLRAALSEIPPDVRESHIAATDVVVLPANVPPWTVMSIRLSPGEEFTIFAEGRVVMSEEMGLWNGPRFHLWGRVDGRGPLLNGTQDTYTFEAPHAGPLELGIYQGEWGTTDGALATPEEGYAMLTGGIAVLVVQWKGRARDGVERLAASAPHEPLFTAERDRLASPVAKPAGWDYLWFLGPTDIFEETHVDGCPGIHAHTRDDVGILQKPVDMALTPDTMLRWRWRVSELPSPVAETVLLTHDYVSIAVAFDNGQDLTYYWSSELAPGEHYRCPLPYWDARETHWVLRSGAEGLGEWCTEERRLLADYEEAVGPPPQRVVAVWLIAVSIFQKRDGVADFAGIQLECGDRRIDVL